MDNADKALPSVELVLGGKTYHLTCNFGTLCRYQEATGNNPFDSAIWSKPSPKDIVALIWAAVVKEDKEMTFEKVSELLTAENIPQMGQLFQAFFGKAAAEPQPGAEEKNAANP